MGNDNKYSKSDEVNARLAAMMDDIVDRVEAEEVTRAAIDDIEATRKAGVISWGSENGVVIGTLADGTRIDTEGNVLNEG